MIPPDVRTRATAPSKPPLSAKNAQIGMFGYCWRSYTDTHGNTPFVIALVFGLAAIPTLSFLKPFIGIRAIWSGAFWTAFIALSLFGLICITACIKYLFLRQRSVSLGHSTWVSIAASFFATLWWPIAIVSLAESMSPQHGILASLIPSLAIQQTRLEPYILRSIPDTAFTPTDVDAVTENSTTDPGSESSQGTTSSPVNNEPTLEKDDEKELSPQNLKSQIVESTGKPDQIIAVGAGISRASALNDAFLNAVRQVVGTVIDSETLIENDELIAEKVITLSNGTIESYTVLSEINEDGLVRLRIVAQVKRADVLQRLRTAKIAVQEVDTSETAVALREQKMLEADALAKKASEEQRSADAEKLFAAAMSDLSENLLEITVDGGIKTVKTSGDDVTIGYTVIVRPSATLYLSWASRLQAALEAVSTQKEELTITAKSPLNEPMRSTSFTPDELSFANWGADEFPRLVLMLTHSSTDNTRMEWIAFSLPRSSQIEALALASQKKTTLKVTMLTEDQKIVAVDRVKMDDTEFCVPYSTKWPGKRNKVSCVVLAPFMFGGLYSTGMEFYLRQNIERTMTLSADEVGRIKHIQAELIIEASKENE